MSDKADYSKIEIKSKGENGTIFTEIYIDGHPLKGVRRFRLEEEAGNAVPILTVDLNALNISVDTPVLLYHEGFAREMDIKFKE